MRLERDSLDSSTTDDKRPIAWPFYVVCDVSKSMWREDVHGAYSPWAVIRDGLMGILEEIDFSPTARDICHLSIIAFGESVETVMALTPFTDDSMTFAMLPRQVLTNYAAVFEHLVDVVQADFARLNQSFNVKRPAVYFMTDGRAEDRNGFQEDSVWARQVQALHGLNCRPIVVAMGLGEADDAALKKIAVPPGPACVADGDAAPQDLLRSIMATIIKSITASGTQGNFVFAIPVGMRRVS